MLFVSYLLVKKELPDLWFCFVQEIPHYYEVVLFSDDVFPVGPTKRVKTGHWHLVHLRTCRYLFVSLRWRLTLRASGTFQSDPKHVTCTPSMAGSGTPLHLGFNRSQAFCTETSARSIQAARS